MIRDRPDLGVLPAEVDALQAILDARAPVRGGGATSLTVAELRVLSFLPYYLSFKEIGQRLGVKETTIKSQSLAIYQKLGAATRSDAVDLAVDAGLLEHFGRSKGVRLTAGLTTRDIRASPPKGRMFPPSGRPEIGVATGQRTVRDQSEAHCPVSRRTTTQATPRDGLRA